MSTNQSLRKKVDKIVVSLIRTFSPEENLVPLKDGETYVAYDRDSATNDLLALFVAEVEKIIGEDETLEPEKEWYAKTKAHGGTYEEYWRLKFIINNQNNLRAEQRSKLSKLGGQNGA